MTTTTLTAREDLKRGDRLQIRRTMYGAVYTSQVYTLQSHNEYLMEVEELAKSIRINSDDDDTVIEFLVITELPTTYGSVIILEEAKDMIKVDAPITVDRD